MALSHSPSIVMNGLVLYVDAANSKSYPGSGSTWFDLSGAGNNFTLGAGVTKSSEAMGVLTFSKDSTGFATNSSLNLATSNYTVISFVRKLSAGDSGRTITALNNNWLLAHHDTTYGDYYAEGWVNNISSPESDTTWRMFTGTGHISNDVYQLYINQNLIVSNSGGSAGPNGWNLNSQYSQYSSCQISNLIVYNRVLSHPEIQQNFEALRGRYGI